MVWSATLTGNESDFQALLAPLTVFLDETPDRVPLTDWYESGDGRTMGFRARAVVGGVFIKLLYNKDICQKYRERYQKNA